MSASGDAARQSLLTVALLILAWLAWMLRDIVMLVGFAALLAYALDPIVSVVERISLRGRSLPRGLSAGIVMLGLVLIMWWALATALPQLVSQVTRFADATPATLARLDTQVRKFAESHGWSRMLGMTPGGTNSTSPLLHGVQEWSLSLAKTAFGNFDELLGVLLLPLLAFYLIADRVAVRSSALGLLPEHLRGQAERVLRAVDPALRAYVRGQALVCFVMGVVMTIVLEILGFPVALLLGVLIGLAEIIPYIGFAIVSTAVALAGYSVSPKLALTGVAAYVVVNTLLGYLVSPRLLGREVKLHPFVITVSVLAGATLLGAAGGILAVPAVAIAQALIVEFAPRSSPRPRVTR